MKTIFPQISSATGLGLTWLLVNAAGWGVGFWAQAMVVGRFGEGGMTPLLGTLLAGGVIGGAQWLALRWLVKGLRPAGMGWAWVILTMFGFVVGFLVGALFQSILTQDASALLWGGITFLAWGAVGLATGVLQWMGLQLYVRGAAWWVGMNGLGYGVGALLFSALRFQFGPSPWIYLVGGLVVGAATLVAIPRFRSIRD